MRVCVCTSSTCVVPNTHTQHAHYMKNVLVHTHNRQQSRVARSVQVLSTTYSLQQYSTQIKVKGRSEGAQLHTYLQFYISTTRAPVCIPKFNLHLHVAHQKFKLVSTSPTGFLDLGGLSSSLLQLFCLQKYSIICFICSKAMSKPASTAC